MGDVVSTPLLLVLSFAIFAESVIVGKPGTLFRVADLIEVDAINIVLGGYFTNNATQVIACFRMAGVEIPGTSEGFAYLSVLSHDGVLAQ